jgi:hypothetical protein
MAALEITQQSQIANAAILANVVIPVVDVNDTFTPPANPGGSNKQMTIGQLLPGVVWPSGDATGAKDAAAINAAVAALPATGGTVTLAPGQYYLVPGAVVIAMTASAPVQVQGNGAVIDTVAGTAGATLRMYGTSASSAAVRAGVTGLTINGNATAGVTGLHAGDVTGLKIDVYVNGFTGAGSIGLNLDNSVSWTEEGDVRAILNDCATAVVMQATTGYNSFGYGNYDYTILAATGQQGLQVLNGAYLYHSSVRVRGDFGSSAGVPANSVLYMGGVNSSAGPAGGDTTIMLGCRLEVQVEVSGSAAHGPVTISMDPTHYAYANGNYGILHFGIPGGIPFTPASVEVGQFGGNFTVNGDATFGLDNGYGAFSPVSAPVAYAAPAVQAAGQIPTPIGDFAAFALAANTTINLAPSSFGSATAGQPQRVTVKVSQPAAGGTYNYTLTWPKPGSPTTAAPAVYWAGGTAPTMSAGAGATDIYDLETFDGVRWYGRATQNVS